MRRSRSLIPEAFARSILAGLILGAAGRVRGDEPGSKLTPVLLTISLAGVSDLPAAPVLRAPDGQLLVRAVDLRRLGLVVPQEPSTEWRGEKFHSLRQIEGLRFEVDEARQALVLTAPARAFSTRRLDAARARPPVPPPSPFSAFVGWDGQYQWTGSASSVSASLSGGIGSKWGSLSSTAIASASRETTFIRRLDTTFISDRPDRLRTLALGDAITSPGGWGRPVRFGGVQWATDFGLAPGFVTFPMPTLAGEAAVPSTVDVLVDGIRRFSSPVAPGPFEITQVPVITGAGVAQVVVKDLLGRQSVVALPYYAAPELLRAGLSSFSVSAGFLREGWGGATDRYGDAMFSATYRRGLSSTFTGEARAEGTADLAAAGVSGSFTIGTLGVFTGAVAASHERDAGTGVLSSVALERRAEGLSFGVQYNRASPSFRDVASTATGSRPSDLLSARVGVSVRRSDSLSVAYLRSGVAARPESELVLVTFSTARLRPIQATLWAARDLVRGSTSVSLSLACPLGARTSASISGEGGGGKWTGSASVQRNPPDDRGFGYRARVSSAASDTRVDAGAVVVGEAGVIQGDVSRSEADTAFRLGLAGGVVMAGGRAFLTRRPDGPFAVAKVGDVEGVEVLAENRPVGRTSKDGFAIVPKLRPYESNRISIRPGDLPMEATPGTLEIQVVPRRQGGVVADFQVVRSRNVLVRLRQPDGSAVPLGAEAVLASSGESFLVAQRGEVWVTGASDRNALRVAWPEHRCEVTFELGRQTFVVGPLVCEGVDR